MVRMCHPVLYRKRDIPCLEGVTFDLHHVTWRSWQEVRGEIILVQGRGQPHTSVAARAHIDAQQKGVRGTELELL